jgi:hypothetical protein
MNKNILFSCLLILFPLALEAAEDNVILKKLYQADQQQRMQKDIDWNVLGQNDRERFATVKKLLKNGQISTAMDYANAARILNHGAGLQDFRLANAFAELGLALEPKNMDLMRIFAATWDRMMMAQNRAQWYATQYSKSGDDHPWELYAVDEQVTDRQRQELSLPTLVEMQEKILKMNQDAAIISKPILEKPTVASAEILLAKNSQTMHALIEMHPALGLFWFELSERGIRKPLNADAVVQLQAAFTSYEKQDAIAIVDGKKPLFNPASSNDACFFNYDATIDANRQLILNISFDCNVKPAPTLVINPNKHYHMIIRGLNSELQGKDLQLVSVDELKKPLSP